MAERIVIVGGAIVGSFCAWSLRQHGHTGSITVVERDPTYEYSSTARSAAAIRTQFATPVNVAMSLHAVDVFRSITTHFGDEADIGYVERGYLILAGAGEALVRREAMAMQRELGADIRELGVGELADRFPYLDPTGVGIATFGESGEGWFDAWSLLSLVRGAARTAGVTYLDAEVSGFETESDGVAGVRMADGTVLGCDRCVIAAGPSSGAIGRLLDEVVPVEPRRRTAFHFECPLDAENFPFLSDLSGIWVKPEGDGFLAGIPPEPSDDPDATGDFRPQHELFEERVWPALVDRLPVMDRLRLKSAWAGHYEVNTLDHNGIVGPHDVYENLVLATGFSGHGVMHAPATGRGVAELVVDGSYRTLDLTPLGWDRIRTGTPLVESVII